MIQKTFVDLGHLLRSVMVSWFAQEALRHPHAWPGGGGYDGDDGGGGDDDDDDDDDIRHENNTKKSESI